MWKIQFLCLRQVLSPGWAADSTYLSRSLADRWGTTVHFTTSFLHSSRLSAFHRSIFHSRPVHSLMLSSHHFLCLPLRLPPWTVPSRIVLASPDDRVTCPYHFRLRLFTEVRSWHHTIKSWRKKFRSSTWSGKVSLKMADCQGRHAIFDNF